MERSQIAIVIPAWNEAETISKVVSELIDKANIIVVNDCSTDKTAELAEQAGAIVVNHKTNKGYDGALSSGFDKAAEEGFKFVITFDADGQHLAESIDKVMSGLDEGFPLVMGIRPAKARITETLMGLYFKVRFGVEDILCGVKGYDMSLYHGNNGFDHINSIGAELSLYALKNKNNFLQIPIRIMPREGESRFGNTLKGNYKIAKAFIRIIKHDLSH